MYTNTSLNRSQGGSSNLGSQPAAATATAPAPEAASGASGASAIPAPLARRPPRLPPTATTDVVPTHIQLLHNHVDRWKKYHYRTSNVVYPPPVPGSFEAQLVAWASKGDATEHRNDVVLFLRDWSPESRLNQCLHLNGLGLKSVPPLPPDTLEVSLDGNALTTLAGVDWPPGITRISAVGNKFAGTLDLDKELPESLTSVCLDDNNIEAVAASSHAKLKVLSLRRNKITHAGQHPPELTDWDVTGNLLTRITAGVLSEKLMHLRAADNKIYEVADDIEVPARLVLVELMRNSFHYFPNILLQVNKDCHVDLSENPIGERIRSWGLVQEDPFTFEL
jgi:hypothetical protein